MTAPRRLCLTCTLYVALLLTGCAGQAPAGSTASGAEAAPSPTAGSAEDAARAACAEIDATVGGGSEVGLLREQQRVFTVAAEHLQVAADADSEYLDDAENVARMAANAADAVALLEEHGEDVASWDAAAEEAWGRTPSIRQTPLAH